MKTKIFLAALFLASAAPAVADNAPPASQPASQSVCLRYHDVDGWGARDRHSMVVNDRFGRKYLINLAGLCNDVDFAFSAGFRPLGGVTGAGCVDRGDHLILRGGGTTGMSNGSCWVNKVQYYTKDMEAADKLARANKQPLASY